MFNILFVSTLTTNMKLARFLSYRNVALGSICLTLGLELERTVGTTYVHTNMVFND